MRALTVIVLLVLAEAAAAADPTALAAFKFEGMPIGTTTLPTFQRAYPKAVRNNKDCEPQVGLQVFLAPDTKATDGVLCHFLDGRLYEVQALYYPDRVNKMGGTD